MHHGPAPPFLLLGLVAAVVTQAGGAQAGCLGPEARLSAQAESEAYAFVMAGGTGTRAQGAPPTDAGADEGAGAAGVAGGAGLEGRPPQEGQVGAVLSEQEGGRGSAGKEGGEEEGVKQEGGREVKLKEEGEEGDPFGLGSLMASKGQSSREGRAGDGKEEERERGGKEEEEEDPFGLGDLMGDKAAGKVGVRCLCDVWVNVCVQ